MFQLSMEIGVEQLWTKENQKVNIWKEKIEPSLKKIRGEHRWKKNREKRGYTYTYFLN